MNSSSRPGHPFKIHPSDLTEATEAIHSSSSNKVNTKEKKAFGLRMKKDLKDSCRTTMKRHSGFEENDAFIARKVSGRNFRFKKRKGKGKSGNKKGSHQRGVKPGRPIWPMEIMISTTRRIGEKSKERRERKENQNSSTPMMETRVPPYENGKGKGGHDKGKSKTFAAIAEKTEEQPAIQQTAPSTEPTHAGWTDQDWDQSWTWNEQGWYSFHEISSPGQALMAFHDAHEHHEKDHPREADPIRCSFRTQFVRRNKSQPFGSKADGACHQPPAQSDLCDPGQWMYQIHGQLACNPAFYSGHRTHEGHRLLSVHPGRDHQGKLDPASSISQYSTNTDVLEQGTVPILLSISQMRNLYMTIEHTPQCDKITCKAFGMNRQAVPVSGAGHALVDLAGVGRVKAHGEIAHKGLTNYVYDDDNSIKFPSGDKSETVFAAKSSETKEDLATLKSWGEAVADSDEFFKFVVVSVCVFIAMTGLRRIYGDHTKLLKREHDVLLTCPISTKCF